MPAVVFSLKYLLNSPSSVIPFYKADNSGMATTPCKGSTVEHVNRIHFHQARTAQKFLSSQHLLYISEKYLATLERNLNSLHQTGTGEWAEYPDLYQFLQVQVVRASIATLMGTKILELNPTLIDDFWKFDTNVPLLMRGFPRWLIPGVYRARDRLHTSIKKWHAHAHAHSDCSKIQQGDPEWEPYFGSKLIRARQNYSLKMKPMNADARAAEDVGLLMAANGNAVPSIFWYIYEALKNEKLRKRMVSEVVSCTTSGGLDISRLLTQPLLLSAYAEVLRLRVAIAMTRVNEWESFNLGGYQIPKGQPLVIFSRPPALNKEAWTLAGKPPAETAPLADFYAERFLVPKKPTENSQDDIRSPAYASTDGEFEFSLEGLAGIWLPYGGGQRMCPGRHFAKSEIISTFAVLFSQYDIELVPGSPDKVEADLRWVPVGALPPVGKVPFRMRKKSAESH
ncbi:hypothetical protein DL769_001270 [Monosporascus sp. CRB-8-3]|nr:hypothetical protein DL769_001270 [Monosporascus sp. CRB-8-3]